MASIGIDTVIISLLARLQSSIVLGYTAEAPRQNISDADFKTAITREIAAHKLEMASKHTLPTSDHQTIMPVISAQTYYIKNDESGTYHLPQVHGIAITPFAWTTKCGWKFGTSVMFSTITAIEPTTNWKHICGKCLQDMRDAMMDEQAGEGSSATSDSFSSDND